MQRFDDVEYVRRVDGEFWSFIHKKAPWRLFFDRKIGVEDDKGLFSNCSSAFLRQHHEESVWRPRLRGRSTQRAGGAGSLDSQAAYVQVHENSSGDAIVRTFTWDASQCFGSSGGSAAAHCM
jgi:hypothetical protein